MLRHPRRRFDSDELAGLALTCDVQRAYAAGGHRHLWADPHVAATALDRECTWTVTLGDLVT